MLCKIIVLCLSFIYVTADSDVLAIEKLLV